MEVQPRNKKVKSCKQESDSSIVDRLPRELFFQILLKLADVKTLLQCTTVCKSWYFLIKSRDFISTHLNKITLPFSSPANNKNNDRLLSIRLLNCIGGVGYSMDFQAQGFDEVWGLPLLPSPQLTSISCCNGLVCFSHIKRDAVILWNPTIKKSITLPPSQPNPPFDRHYRYLWLRETGLGFDSRTNDYKVLRIVLLTKFRGRTSCVSRWVEVYSLNSGSWKKVVDTLPSELKIISGYPTSQSVFVNGYLHFVGVEKIEEQPEGRHVIVGFGLDDGVVNKIALPETLSSIRTAERKLVIMGYKSTIAAAHYGILEEGPYDVWVMKEYCKVDTWTKMFTIQTDIYIRTYLFTRGDGMMVVGGRDGGIYSIDPVRKQVNLLALDWNILHLSPCVESLALLNHGGHRISDSTKRVSRKPAYLKDYDV